MKADPRQDAQRIPGAVVKAVLREIRLAFYGDEVLMRGCAFFRDRQMLLQAVTFPAKTLKERGWRVEWQDYQSRMIALVKDIRTHCKTTPTRRPAYILHCVQDHMRHHWEEWYDASKRIDQLVDKAVDGARRDSAFGSLFIDALAIAHDLVAPRSRQASPAKTRFRDHE